MSSTGFFLLQMSTPQDIYKFDEEGGGYKDCNVTYIWAVGGFLLVQPPSIFQFSSLLFSTPANSLTEVELNLPYACRALINETMSCSCKNEMKDDLEIFTRHVSIILISGMLSM